MNTNPSSQKRPRNSGFIAHVDRANLVELIQLNCLGRQRCAFEVTSGTERGLLFFDAGQVVHAECGPHRGVDAVIQLLALDGGRFRPAHASWPEDLNIDEPWETLLLRAIQANDERARSSLSLPAVEHPSGHDRQTDQASARRKNVAQTDESGEVVEFPRNKRSMPSVRPPRPRPVSVHLKANGEVIEEHGDSAQLQECAAYVKQVAELLGADLGLGQLLAVQAETRDKQLGIYADTHGGTMAVVGTRAELDETLKGWSRQ